MKATKIKKNVLVVPMNQLPQLWRWGCRLVTSARKEGHTRKMCREHSRPDAAAQSTTRGRVRTGTGPHTNTSNGLRVRVKYSNTHAATGTNTHEQPHRGCGTADCALCSVSATQSPPTI